MRGEEFNYRFGSTWIAVNRGGGVYPFMVEGAATSRELQDDSPILGRWCNADGEMTTEHVPYGQLNTTLPHSQVVSVRNSHPVLFSVVPARQHRRGLQQRYSRFLPVGLPPVRPLRINADGGLFARHLHRLYNPQFNTVAEGVERVASGLPSVLSRRIAVHPRRFEQDLPLLTHSTTVVGQMVGGEAELLSWGEPLIEEFQELGFPVRLIDQLKIEQDLDERIEQMQGERRQNVRHFALTREQAEMLILSDNIPSQPGAFAGYISDFRLAVARTRSAIQRAIHIAEDYDRYFEFNALCAAEEINMDYWAEWLGNRTVAVAVVLLCPLDLQRSAEAYGYHRDMRGTGQMHVSRLFNSSARLISMGGNIAFWKEEGSPRRLVYMGFSPSNATTIQEQLVNRMAQNVFERQQRRMEQGDPPEPEPADRFVEIPDEWLEGLHVDDEEEYEDEDE